MKTKLLLFPFILLLFAAASIVSCRSTGAVAKKITIGSGEIPPAMANEDFTIIGILQGRRQYDKYVEKQFATYTGNYVLAKKKEISDKYPDVNKYRYYMDCTIEYSSSSNMDGKNVTTAGYRYFIVDRKTGKQYTRRGKSSFFGKEMNAYIKAIEAVRKK